jgi:hypothetical protein
MQEPSYAERFLLQGCFCFCVNLTGIAKNDAEKSLVTKLVSDVMGVTSVVNEMTVATPINDK